MDMTLAEQLVWAAVFAQYEQAIYKTIPAMDVDGRILSAAQSASRAVMALRSSYNYAFSKNSVREHMGQTAFMHLQQMVFKAED